MTETASPSAPPLSVAQEALWDQSFLAPNQLSYNETISIRKDGRFDVPAFRRALNEFVRRHEMWRTTFDNIGGQTVQVVHPALNLDLPLIDLSHLTLEQAERQAVVRVAEIARVPYDLRRGPLLRPRLFRFRGRHHRLYLGLHHLIFDGLSVNRVVLPELVALYDAFCSGCSSPLPEPPAQYSDFARWEQEWIAEPRIVRRLEYWRQRLTDAPVLRIPLDRERPLAPRSRGGMLALSLPAETVDDLRQVGQDARASLFQVLATVWALLLHRYSGSEDVVFATAANLRQRPELESVVGYAVSPLALRIDLSGDPSVADLVTRVRNDVLDGLDHLVPFERLVRELPTDSPTNANPIYQTLIVLEPGTVTPDASWSMHQLDSAVGDAVGNAKLDLELQLDERPEGHILGRLIFDRDLFDRATAERIAAHWLRLATAVAADPAAPVSTLPILTAAEEHRQLVEWNATATERPCVTVHDLIRARAVAQPRATAVSIDGESISYAQLERRAGSLARRLLAAGVQPGDVVAVCCEVSLELVVATLGVLEAGAAHLLLDPELSSERLDLMMEESGPPSALVAPPALAARLNAAPARVLGPKGPGDADNGDAPAPAVAVDPIQGLCCLQPASATTGRPGGAPLRHASVVNLVTAMAEDLGVSPDDSALALPATIFSTPAIALWLPLVAGARVVLAPEEIAGDGAATSRLIRAEQVTFMHALPSAWRALIDGGLRPARALRALSGGEPLSRRLADEILERCRVVWNAYGTAQTSGYRTLARVETAAPITIGRPISNTCLSIVDDHGSPVPVGVTGELVVGGDGPDCRTGDRARWLPDGRVQLV